MSNVSIYDGDIALVETVDGADLSFDAGQASMDAGLFTAALISLFTEPGWWGNSVVPTDSRLGSDIESIRERTLTNATRLDFLAEAREALAWMVTEGIAESVTVDAAIASPGMLAVEITVAEPGVTTPRTLRYQLNWDALRAQR